MNPAYPPPREHPPLVETYEVVVAGIIFAAGCLAWYIARERYHLTGRQVAELACYLAIGITAFYSAAFLLLTARSRRERQWPHPPLVVRPKRDERATREAWGQDSVVLGYDVHGKPWLWPDRVRVMQGIVLGMTGIRKDNSTPQHHHTGFVPCCRASRGPASHTDGDFRRQGRHGILS